MAWLCSKGALVFRQGALFPVSILGFLPHPFFA